MKYRAVALVPVIKSDLPPGDFSETVANKPTWTYLGTASDGQSVWVTRTFRKIAVPLKPLRQALWKVLQNKDALEFSTNVLHEYLRLGLSYAGFIVRIDPSYHIDYHGNLVAPNGLPSIGSDEYNERVAVKVLKDPAGAEDKVFSFGHCP